MRSDLSIKEDVLDELAWQPNIDETEIGVTVKNGVVTLNGIVDNYTKKRAVENAVKNVTGVKAVAEEIKVQYSVNDKQTDADIAKAAFNAIKWHSSLPDDVVNVKVEDGWVYLTGEVEWEYQKTSAINSVEEIKGVHGVSDSITLKRAVKPVEIKEKIKRAFERMADVEAKNIIVEVEGHTVKLIGKVNSILEKDEARKTAYYAPGVYEVKNELEVI
ncbi:BON domain-containing protein [uncultured Winogradskyella sp.]|uniref:BON domain-containing protein n=1 Tax=uncultured Winogradskyella sp. TaxID=395353 RepID=UPI0026048210|nr:BON domain-containing protein [uncultured Winogradskyella sp.]|tara:strand:+ start:199 stop:849 length:651 start_codon:yes stop_codon:yes gene_type:complete